MQFFVCLYCRYYEYLIRHNNGQHHVAHGNAGFKKPSIAYGVCRAWFRQYSKKNGDKMPNVEAIHLPSWVTKNKVYDDYQREITSTMVSPISKSSFYQMWADHFSHVKIPKVSL